jgi:deazaflavin-dependent oxidoreductase (nitroreductase family)
VSGIRTSARRLSTNVTEINREQLVADVNALHDFNHGVTEEFRANGGKVGGPFEGGDLLLLHTTGAKSGKPRISPLAYLTIDGKMIIFGSYAGAPKDPAWVHNLRATPHARIEVGTDAYDVEVRELPSAEREAMYPTIIEIAPVFAEYQAKTTRQIPLFELTRA